MFRSHGQVTREAFDFFDGWGRNGLLSCLKSVRLRCPSQSGGRSRRWERSVLEELGCFASTQRLEPIPAS